jgi:hypothetical protein
VLIVMSLGLGLPAAAGAQSAGDDQYADPYAGQEQSQGSSGSSQGNGNQGDDTQSTGQAGSGSGSSTPASAPAAPATDTRASSGSNLAYTGFPAGLAALLGALALATGLMLRVIAGRPPTPRRGAVLVLGRDVRLQARARQR